MTRVVLAHGFTQTGASWTPIRTRLLADGHDVVTPDLPGHGTATTDDPDLWPAAIRLGDTGGHAAYVGYSMGGRYCLHLALARPELVTRLVLVGTTPGIEDEVERRARRQADHELAASIECDGVDVFLDRWLANPLFATLPRRAAAMETRRVNTAAGLAASLRHAGTGNQQPVWDRLAALDMPVLLVTGEADTKFTAIADRMASVIGPNAARAVVANAGHAVHLEQPDVFVDLVGPFLDG